MPTTTCNKPFYKLTNSNNKLSNHSFNSNSLSNSRLSNNKFNSNNNKSPSPSPPPSIEPPELDIATSTHLKHLPLRRHPSIHSLRPFTISYTHPIVRCPYPSTCPLAHSRLEQGKLKGQRSFAYPFPSYMTTISEQDRRFRHSIQDSRSSTPAFLSVAFRLLGWSGVELRFHSVPADVVNTGDGSLFRQSSPSPQPTTYTTKQAHPRDIQNSYFSYPIFP